MTGDSGEPWRGPMSSSGRPTVAENERILILWFKTFISHKEYNIHLHEKTYY